MSETLRRLCTTICNFSMQPRHIKAQVTISYHLALNEKLASSVWTSCLALLDKGGTVFILAGESREKDCRETKACS